jgi:transposase
MYQDNLFALDLSKKSIQGALFDRTHKVQFNREYSPRKMIDWLSKQKPLTVAMEACATAHYWARTVNRLGHHAVLVPTRTANSYRQGHKTNATDALAVGVAARQPTTRFVAPKTIEQQELQSVERFREHLSDHLTATSNMVRSVLAEFGLVIGKGKKAFKQGVLDHLEDAENELPAHLRAEIFNQWDYYLQLEQRLEVLTRTQRHRLQQHEACQRLLQLESVGPVNALGLYLALGDQGGSFKNGREASACIGATPKQYSTGDTVTMGGISKTCANKRLRSNLIQGARSVIQKLKKRDPRNAKEKWLKALIARRGEGRAAVALANKTIRVAWAMLRYGDDFNLHPNMV